MRISDWSSDVCSSDLDLEEVGRCLVGRDVEAGPGDHGLIRVIAGVVVNTGRLAKASLDLSLLRAELPGQAVPHVGVEIDGKRLVGCPRLGGVGHTGVSTVYLCWQSHSTLRSTQKRVTAH